MSDVDPRTFQEPGTEGPSGEAQPADGPTERSADDLPIGSSGPESGAPLSNGDRNPDAGVDEHLDGPDIQHPTNWRIS